MNVKRLLKILFPLLTTLIGIFVGAHITLTAQRSSNKEYLLYKITASCIEYSENSKIINGLWDNNKNERIVVANSISFDTLEILLNSSEPYKYLDSYYTTSIFPKLRRSKKVIEFYLNDVTIGVQLDGTLKAMIASEFSYQQNFLKEMALELTDNENWVILIKGLEKNYPNSSLID
jgi:hypothetical protein